MYIDQITTGDDYSKLNKTITINILDYNCISNERYHNSFHIREDKEYFKLTDVLEIHFVELKKEKNDYRNNKLAQWIEFLKADSEEVLKQMAETSEDLKKALNILLTMSQDKEMRASYLSREMALRDEISRIEENRKAGREEGRKEGREEGREEMSIEIAKNLLDVLDDETIALKTGLKIERIRELRNK